MADTQQLAHLTVSLWVCVELSCIAKTLQRSGLLNKPVLFNRTNPLQMFNPFPLTCGAQAAPQILIMMAIQWETVRHGDLLGSIM